MSFRFHLVGCAALVVLWLVLPGSCQSLPACVGMSFPSSSSIENFLNGRNTSTRAHSRYISTISEAMDRESRACSADQTRTRALYTPIPYAIFGHGVQSRRWVGVERLCLSNAQSFTTLVVVNPPRMVSSSLSASQRSYCYAETAGQCNSCNVWYNDLYIHPLLSGAVDVNPDVNAAGACFRTSSTQLQCWEATQQNASSRSATSKRTVDLADCSGNEPWIWEKPMEVFMQQNGSNASSYLDRNIRIVVRQYIPDPVNVPLVSQRFGAWSTVHSQCQSDGTAEWVHIYTVPIVALCTNALHDAGLCEAASLNEYTVVGSSWVSASLQNSYNVTQCPASASSTGNATQPDVFRGSASCGQVVLNDSTSKSLECIEHARGFTLNSYHCSCPGGTYLSDANNSLLLRDGRSVYTGSHVVSSLVTSNVDTASITTCRQCMTGCRTCTEFTSCLRKSQASVRIPVLAINIVVMAAIIAITVYIHSQESTTIIKSSSPYYLYGILASAVLAHLEGIVLFPDLNNAICALQPWPRHLAFVFLFGFLFGKVWRVQVLARMPPNRIKVWQLDETIKRFVFVCSGIMLLYLILWTGVGRSTVEIAYDNDGSSYERCTVSYWRYILHGFEFGYLFLGLVVTQMTRKLVFDWPEYKYLLGTFANATVIKSLVAIFYFTLLPDKYADSLYLLQFFDNLFTVSTSVFIIFGHKIYLIQRAKSNRGIGPTVPAKLQRTESIAEGKEVQEMSLQQAAEGQRTNNESNLITSLGIMDVMFGCWMGPLKADWSVDYYGLKDGEATSRAVSAVHPSNHRGTAYAEHEKTPVKAAAAAEEEDSGMPYLGDD